MDEEKEQNLIHEIASILNKYSVENASNTPDFILAQYLVNCLKTFDTAVQQRKTWYGLDIIPLRINIDK